MTDRTRESWICITLFLAAFALRLFLALQLPFPQLDDPAGYIQLVRNIAAGRGLVSDVLWNYWVPFPAVTHASNEFWMPLASIIMAGALRLFGGTLFAAQLPGMISGALLAPLVYVMGRTLWPGPRRWLVLFFCIWHSTLHTDPLWPSVVHESSCYLYLCVLDLSGRTASDGMARVSRRWRRCSGGVLNA